MFRQYAISCVWITAGEEDLMIELIWWTKIWEQSIKVGMEENKVRLIPYLVIIIRMS